MEPNVQPFTTQPAAGAIMSRSLVTVTMDDTLATVQQLFKAPRCHHLLVVEDRTLVGIISDRDLLKALSPNIGTMSETDRDRATLNKRAHQIMTRDPISVRPTTPLDAAAALMLEEKVSCLPVTSDQHRLEGILSWRDILKALIATLQHSL